MSTETTPQRENNRAVYDESQIQVLEGMEAVRKRPGMYIGPTDIGGLHTMVREVVDNSVDEVMAGRATAVEVVINTDGSVTVSDDGQGIPVGLHPKEGVSTLTLVMTKLHAGGKFGGEGYKVSAGLHGVGVSAVNALSERLRVDVYDGLRTGFHWYQEYQAGVPVTEVKKLKKTERHGTTTTFLPDATIIQTLDYNFKTLAQRFREMAYLNKGLRFKFIDLRHDQEMNFYFEGGIVSYVRHLNKDRTALHRMPFYAERIINDVAVEVALQYTESYDTDSVYSFANNINNTDGGSHVSGFRTALTRVINTYARAKNLLKEADANLTGDDVREGLTAVISVKLRDPQFSSQTKEKLVSPEASGAVATVFGDTFAAWLEENPQEAKRIIEKTIAAARTRLAVQKVRETARKSAMEGFSLPGKLADCSDTNPARCEIYVVEGDSAGGCFSGNTAVALTDGRALSFRELVEEQAQGKEHFCYTIRNDGTVGVERVLHARVTKRDAQVVRVTLDNGEQIVCTPDHRFMLRDGSYKQASELAAGTSLMPLYRKLSSKTEPGITIDGYEMTWNPRSTSWLFTHTLAERTPEFRTQRKAALDGTYYRKTVIALKQFVSNDTLDTDSYQAHRQETADRSLLRFDRFCARYFDGNVEQAREAVLNHNHSVVSVEVLDERIDVYDIEVPHTHNFALASGVFVHNSAKQGRDRRFQAILPLRGKILNVEKSRLDKMLSNAEVRALITAIGAAVGEQFDAAKLRYHRILLMTDADVDGSHIRTLLLTFFFRYMRDLITNGHLYIAQPPLYRVKLGKDQRYVFNDEDLRAYMNKLTPEQQGKADIQRYKGLGEMNPEQLWETTMNPANRVILQVTLEDAQEADETFTMLMGDLVPPRRRFIQTHASEVKNLDV